MSEVKFHYIKHPRLDNAIELWRCVGDQGFAINSFVGETHEEAVQKAMEFLKIAYPEEIGTKS